MGYNDHDKTETFCNDFYTYGFRHSEQHAIKQFDKLEVSAKKCSLVNIRYSRDKEYFLNSRPCSQCLKLIRLYGFKEVWYTTQKGFRYEAV